jgi:hypothetical protein
VDETPTIVIEFVSAGKRNLIRDYEEKRREYASIGVQEDWVLNRFNRTLTVFRADARLVFEEDHIYTTPLLPGFELPLAKLFELSSGWDAPRHQHGRRCRVVESGSERQFLCTVPHQKANARANQIVNTRVGHHQVTVPFEPKRFTNAAFSAGWSL